MDLDFAFTVDCSAEPGRDAGNSLLRPDTPSNHFILCSLRECSTHLPASFEPTLRKGPSVAVLNQVGIGSAFGQVAHPTRDDTVTGSDFVELSLLLLGV